MVSFEQIKILSAKINRSKGTRIRQKIYIHLRREIRLEEEWEYCFRVTRYTCHENLAEKITFKEGIEYASLLLKISAILALDIGSTPS